MNPLIKIISWTATNPGSGGAAATAVTGDSLVIENDTSPTGPMLLGIWGQQGTAGFQQFMVPSGHDQIRDYRFRVGANDSSDRFVDGLPKYLRSQETATVTIGGGAAETDTGTALISYKNLPGSSARLIDWEELVERHEKPTTIDMTLVGAAAGYTGEALINSSTNLLIANRTYALLGFETDLNTVNTVYIQGPDTGKNKIGAPGTSSVVDWSNQYFCTKSRAFRMPTIPIFSSANQGSTYFGFLQNAGNVSPKITAYLSLLRGE